MATKLEGKKVGSLVISSDVVATANAVTTYVSSVSADLQHAIDSIGQIAVDGYVPLSALSSEVLKIISSNYVAVANYLDGTPEDQIVTIQSGDSQSI